MPLGPRADASDARRTLLEETHELLEAIDAGDADAIRDELGDLLLQVVFHAQIAADEGRWDVDDVADGSSRSWSTATRTSSATSRSPTPTRCS